MIQPARPLTKTKDIQRLLKDMIQYSYEQYIAWREHPDISIKHYHQAEYLLEFLEHCEVFHIGLGNKPNDIKNLYHRTVLERIRSFGIKPKC